MAEGGLVAIDVFNDLPLGYAVCQKLEASKELNILIVGRFQVGKSSLINSLFFKEGESYKMRAEEGLLSPCTRDVTPYTFLFKDCVFNIYDSPGFQDEESYTKYLKSISKACLNIHLVIYCKKMGEPMRPAEKKALKTLNNAFGSSIWGTMIIALTFANLVDPPDPDVNEVDYFKEIKERNVEELKQALEELSIKEEDLECLKTRVHPVGSARVFQLPGMEVDWRIDFWIGCLEACKEEAKGVLLALDDPRITYKIVGSSIATFAGVTGAICGAACVGAGIALTVTGILAPIGIALFAVGVVMGLLGIGTATGGSIWIARKVTMRPK